MVTDLPMDSCHAVFAGAVGRGAMRRRSIHVPGEANRTGETLTTAVQVGSYEVTCTVRDRCTDREVRLDVRSEGLGDETTATTMIGRLAAAFVLPGGSGRRPPWVPQLRSIRRHPELVSVVAAFGGPAAPYPLDDPDPDGRVRSVPQLLRQVGWAAIAPWGLSEGDPDQDLDDLLVTLDQVADPLACLHRWCVGALPADGFMALGVAALVAHRAGWPTARTAREDPGWHRLLDACLGFLRANHVGPARVPSWAWERWLATGGDTRSWLPPVRSLDEAEPEAPSPLDDDEVRLLAVTGPGARLLVTCRGTSFVALDVTDIRPGGGADDLVITLAKRDDLYDCYQEAAWASPYRAWAHTELEPFFPVPPPDI